MPLQRKISLSFLLLFFSFSVWANYYPIIKLHKRTEVIAEIPNDEGIAEGNFVVITDENDKVIATGRIRDIERDTEPKTIKVKILEVIDNKLVLVGDKVSIFNKEFLDNHEVPGFNSLTLGGGNTTDSKYKELAYFGVFTSEGHTLDKGEILISPFQAQAGISDTFGVKVVNALWIDGYMNAGAKLRVMHNKYAKITINGLGAYRMEDPDWIAQGGAVITLPTNSKFQSHLMANFIFDEQKRDARATENLKLFKTSDIRSITEYITDSWDRVLYGPVYNVELQTFGGTVSYMWIWKTLHISLGVATRDFTKLSFGSDDGYYYVYDLFLRF